MNEEKQKERILKISKKVKYELTANGSTCSEATVCTNSTIYPNTYAAKTPINDIGEGLYIEKDNN